MRKFVGLVGLLTALWLLTSAAVAIQQLELDCEISLTWVGTPSPSCREVQRQFNLAKTLIQHRLGIDTSGVKMANFNFHRPETTLDYTGIPTIEGYHENEPVMGYYSHTHPRTLFFATEEVVFCEALHAVYATVRPNEERAPQIYKSAAPNIWHIIGHATEDDPLQFNCSQFTRDLLMLKRYVPVCEQSGRPADCGPIFQQRPAPEPKSRLRGNPLDAAN